MTTTPDTQVTLNVQKKFGTSLVSVPVGTSGVSIFTVGVGQTLTITDLTLWVGEVGSSGAPTLTPTVWLMERDVTGVTVSEFVWQFRGIAEGDIPRITWNTVNGVKFQAGSQIVIRVAGIPNTDIKVGYTLLGYVS